MEAMNPTKSLPPEKDVRTLGQVFTPRSVVNFMISLRQRQGRILEPSCGDGAFVRVLSDCTAIEIDSRLAPASALRADFFAISPELKFPSVIGNPPYVRFRDIPTATRRLLETTLLNGHANLYLHFIEKAVRHLTDDGELIFITPREFLKATAAAQLNAWLYQQGTITHAVELGDARIFDDASPNCLIWRFEKGNVTRQTRYAVISSMDNWEARLKSPTWKTVQFTESAGQLLFGQIDTSLLLRDIASVKVGAASGANDIYADPVHGNRQFVYSQTRRTGKTRAMIWPEGNHIPDALLAHRDRLLRRDIRPFDESNWWQWGRGYPLSDHPRIYVNALTRERHPFFLHDSKHFDGSVLAVFPHDPASDLNSLCEGLNAVDWTAAGFVCDGRVRFTQRSLENAPLPQAFRDVSLT